MTKVRMEWTLAEFYADGGTTRFVDRMAAVLGIDVSQIKVVAVYEGSVIIDFFIESLYSSEEDADEVEEELDEITQLLKQTIFASSSFGAPVLGLEANDKLLVGDKIKNFGGNQVDFAALVTDENIWDRYVRTQELLEAQKEEQLLFDEPSISIEQNDSLENSISITSLETKSQSALKYSVLVTAAIVLILLLVTSIFVFRCISSRSAAVAAAEKTKKVTELDRTSNASVAQFKPTIDDGKQFAMGPRHNRALSKKMNGKEYD